MTTITSTNAREIIDDNFNERHFNWRRTLKQGKKVTPGMILVLFTLSLLILSGVNAQSSATRGGTPGTTTPGVSTAAIQQPVSCSNPQQCREIDEVWQRIGTNVRNSDTIWDNSVTPVGWKVFTAVYKPLAPPASTVPGTSSAQPSAPLPSLCFPIERNSFQEKGNLDNFGGRRDKGNRCHAGLDLLTQNEARVIAVDSGEIVGIQPTFVDPPTPKNPEASCGATGAAALLVYYQNLPGVGEVTINYGEILPSDATSFREGQTVVKGQFLGRASPCGMLHFEMYEGRVTHTINWDNPPGPVETKNQCALNPAYLATKPPKIKDPTGFIESIKNNFCGPGAGASLSSVSPVISGTAIPYGAKAECDIRLQGEFVQNNPSPTNLRHWQQALQDSGASGKTWIGKMNGNGISDNNNRPDGDVGRDTIMFIPCRTDLSKPVELAYYFHGNSGFNYEGSGSAHEDMREVLAQIKQMSQAGRNVILVYPEMIYSLNGNRVEKSKGANLWDGSDANLALLHSSVQSALNDAGLTGQVAYISITGHSRGGAAIGWAARNPDSQNNYLQQIGVDRIIFSDAGYADWHYRAPYENYVKLNPAVSMDILVQDPSQRSGAHDPTHYAINFLRDVGGTATAGWSSSCSRCDVSSCCVTQSNTPGASANTPFPVPGTNIYYYPLTKGHDGISEMSLAWIPSTSRA